MLGTGQIILAILLQEAWTHRKTVPREDATHNIETRRYSGDSWRESCYHVSGSAADVTVVPPEFTQEDYTGETPGVNGQGVSLL